MLQNYDDAAPFILFKAANSLYAADSRYVSTIMELPEYQALPDAPPYITGIFPHRDGNVTMFDLRTALQLSTLAEEYRAFAEMLEARKQDHTRWIAELERCLETGEEFHLATDPHQCALGKWFDAFHSENPALNHFVGQLDEPHQKLHRCAVDAMECRRLDGGREERMRQIMAAAREDYVPRVLHILDGAKELFRTTAYHEMVLVLGGETTLGIVVDEVVSVEQLSEEPTGMTPADWTHSPYIGRILRSEAQPELILEISIPAILAAAREDGV